MTKQTETPIAQLTYRGGTLTYRRVARKGVDWPAPGVIYLDHFGTGWQELVFKDHEHAKRFVAAKGA
jgi:hypothetical protein